MTKTLDHRFRQMAVLKRFQVSLLMGWAWPVIIAAYDLHPSKERCAFARAIGAMRFCFNRHGETCHCDLHAENESSQYAMLVFLNVEEV